MNCLVHLSASEGAQGISRQNHHSPTAHPVPAALRLRFILQHHLGSVMAVRSHPLIVLERDEDLHRVAAAMKEVVIVAALVVAMVVVPAAAV